MEQNDLASKVMIESAKAVASETYNDVIHPTAKNIGQAMGTLTSTLNVLLAPISWAVYGFDVIDSKVKDSLHQKLSNTPIENLKEPDSNVVIPAYEALRYSLDKESLKNMYINLIASSMKKDTSNSAHPAFVEIIKQLSSLEAILLKKLVDTNDYEFAIVKTRLEKNDGSGYEWIKHIISPNFGMNVINCESYSVALDNLYRLKLIEIDYTSFLINNAEYFDIENGEIVARCKKDAPNLKKDYDIVKCKRGELSITQFGKSFISACIK